MTNYNLLKVATIRTTNNIFDYVIKTMRIKYNKNAKLITDLNNTLIK